MHKMRLRSYLYIAIGVAFMISTLTDPEMHAVSRITAMFNSLGALSRDVFSALR
jgi:transcriptional/translational regulatory protein YebC/TACO1